MSMNFYTYRDGYDVKALDRYDSTHEQQEAAGWITGPNFANVNARKIGRVLGITFSEEGATADPAKVLEAAKLILALEVGNELSIDWSSVNDNYLADALRQIMLVCTTAIKWNTDLLIY